MISTESETEQWRKMARAAWATLAELPSLHCSLTFYPSVPLSLCLSRIDVQLAVPPNLAIICLNMRLQFTIKAATTTATTTTTSTATGNETTTTFEVARLTIQFICNIKI